MSGGIYYIYKWKTECAYKPPRKKRTKIDPHHSPSLPPSSRMRTEFSAENLGQINVVVKSPPQVVQNPRGSMVGKWVNDILGKMKKGYDGREKRKTLWDAGMEMVENPRRAHVHYS